MSADLLAEFGGPGSSSAHYDTRVRELGSNSAPDIPDEPDILNEEAPVGRRKSGTAENLWHKDEKGADVLFDASTDTYDLDDEFGDFENGEQEPAEDQQADKLHNSANKDAPPYAARQFQGLLDFDGPIGSPKRLERDEICHHEDEWGDFSTSTTFSTEQPKQEDLSVYTRASDSGKATALDRKAEEETWEPFEDDGAVTSSVDPTCGSALTSSGPPKVAIQPKEHPRGTSSSASATSVPAGDMVRPTNIPPPAILLQILPIAFVHLASTNNAEQPTQFSSAILQAYSVAVYLIAGRALRWKRNNILSQSTKIGPATAGGRGGGMKLAAIDKSESIKEEREIADVLLAWNKHAHLFNSTVTKAGVRRPMMALSAKLRPRPAKGAVVLSSPHACALCGLKRDERVADADINVDDSFGEFWVDHWGHRDCRDFWQQNKAFLPQR
jgi:hypothetical protein